MTYITECRMCKKKELTLFLDLGHQPHSDRFLKKEQLNESETFFPLRVVICQNCGLVQLDYVVSPKILYQEDYLYESSITKQGISHYHEMAKNICEKFNLSKNSLIVDIGSNVGVLLKEFKDQGMTVLGIDPAQKIAEIANSRGIETWPELFSSEIAEKIKSKKGNVNIVTGTNVFAHIHDLDDLIKGVYSALSPEGIFIFELPYLVDLLDNLEYDTIYHQHLSYISVKPLINFLNKFDMDVFDVEKQEIHGGSIRVFVAKKGKREIKPSVQEFVRLEEGKQVYSIDRLKKFANNVKNQKKELTELLAKLKKQGKKIVGVSAPAKGNTLLNYCRLNTKLLDYITEKSKLKINRFCPGTHIPIYSDEKLLEDKPDYALILAWNFAEEIIENLDDFRKQGGKFIIPIPNPKIIE